MDHLIFLGKADLKVISVNITSNSSSGINFVFSGLAANIRKSIPFEVQSGFRPLPLSHHFKTKLKCQKKYL